MMRRAAFSVIAVLYLLPPGLIGGSRLHAVQGEATPMLDRLNSEERAVWQEAWRELRKANSAELYRDALKSTQWEVRFRAATELRRMRDTASSDALMKLLEDPHPSVVERSKSALVRIGDPRVVELLLEAANNGDASVISGLAQLEDPRVGPALIPFLEHESPFVRENTIWAIFRRKYAAAVPRIILLARDASETQPVPHGPHDTVAAAAVFVLGEFKSEEAIPVLVEVCGIRANYGRPAEALIKIGGPKVIAAMHELLKSSDNMLELSVAASVVEKLGDKTAIPLLTEARKRATDKPSQAYLDRALKTLTALDER